MKYSLRISYLSFFLSLFLGINFSHAQLLYEGMVFDGMGKPLLENASSVAVSPDGNFVYVTSYNDNAVTVYNRETSGSPGALTFLETKKNEVDDIVGMNGAYHLRISPDGNHLYVAGSLDDAIVVFSRNVLDGTLTYMTTYWNNVDGIEGIDGAYYIDMSVDGNHVYVAGPDENAIAVFKRNVITGSLIFVQMIQDESGGVTEMNYPLALMVSPNGKNVYVSSFGDNAINVFSRNLTTGELTFVEHHKEGLGGVSGLQAAFAPYVTPDGQQVYVSGLDSDALVAFNRDPVSGALTYVNTYVDNSNGVDGISGPTTIRVSTNGSFLYAAGSNEDAVSVFSRNAATGEITFLTMVQEGVNGVSGISYPTYVELSADGNNLYVTGFASASLAVFDLNEVNGTATFQNAETEGNLGVSGLDGSAAVTLSPDGNFVYVAGNNDDAIVVFERNSNTGMLTFVQKIEDSATTDGLNGINCIAVSADGNHAYATGFWDKTIVLFQRNIATGELTYIERYKDEINGVDGLNGANFITLSPDGNNVYVTAFWEHSVAVFNRNPTTGALTFVEVFKDGALGVDGLNRASGVSVSPDGSSVYVAGNTDNAIAIFERDMTDGTLTFQEAIKDGINGVDGIQRITAVVVSPNSANVYATGLTDDAVAIFNRDATTGLLTFVGQAKNGVGNVVGLDGPSRLTISENGEHIYITSTNDDAIVAMRRNVSTGELVFEGAVFDVQVGINGLDGAEYVTVSPDGKNMYVASTNDDAVAVFSCTYIFDSQEVICEGDSVVVGANAYKISGTYVDTFSFGACKSVTTLDLIVQPALTVMDVEICTGDNYLFDGTTYNQTGVHNANYTSAYGCDSTVTLNLTVVTEFSVQNIVASICMGETFPGGYITSGEYTNVYTSSFGCDSTVVLSLTVNPVYNEIIDVEICPGDFYVLGTQNYIATGTFVESFTTVNGCDSVITLNLTVVQPEVTLNEAICEGESYSVGQFTFTDAGTYNVTVESGAGCNSEVTLNLVVNNSPTISLNEEICEGDSYTIGNSVYIQSGFYTDILEAANGCDSTIVLDLTVHAVTTNLNETICEGDSYTVGTTTYSTSGAYTNVLTSTSGCGDSTVTLVLIVEPTSAELDAIICDGDSYTLGNNVFTESGTYNENIISGAGCTIAYTINLTVLPPVEATETITDDNGSGNGAIDLSVLGGMSPYTFEWSNNGTTEDISNLIIGTYTVTITDAIGCTATYVFVVDQVSATFHLDANIDVKLYPNPAAVGGLANLSFNINKQQTLKIKLFDSVGRLISAETVDFLSGNSVHSLRLPKVQGLYQVYIETEEGKYKAIQLSVK
jgi:6-phosphogluconolactonase (cycloisomerase 2 family)